MQLFCESSSVFKFCIFILCLCYYRRFGFRIEEPSGENVSVLLQSQFLHGLSPWHPFTNDIRRRPGLVQPIAAWTRQVLGRDHYLITCQSRPMHLLCTCIIQCHQTGTHQEPLLQNPLRTALKLVPWQHRLTAWEDHRSHILTSPFRSMAPQSNFRLVRMLLLPSVHVTLPVIVAEDRLVPCRHKLSAKNVSSRYSVLSGIPLVLMRWGWKLKSIQWWLIWQERIMEEQMCSFLTLITVCTDLATVSAGCVSQAVNFF